MKIAIHINQLYYTRGWLEYCERKHIEVKRVNCYDSDIIRQLEDCDALMWHHDHQNARDTRFAKQLLMALEFAGKKVFPDVRTCWHFDDKLGQKYLFESVGAPLIPSYAFFSRKDAMDWARKTTYPKVFKLRGGSGSEQVKLVKNLKDASGLINRAFGRGFSRYNAWGNLKERWRKYRTGITSLGDVVDGTARLLIPTPYSIVQGKDRGYVYFQDFIPGNTTDIRIVYIFNRIYGFSRRVRPGDFRASGGGMFETDPSLIPREALRIAMETSRRLQLQTAAYDFVLDNGKPLIAEISYGTGYMKGQFDLGYWDEDLQYHGGSWDGLGRMVEGVIEAINQDQSTRDVKEYF
jgi:glutathione synthase/RimK-type ligase-like ATP-grasp enzyme